MCPPLSFDHHDMEINNIHKPSHRLIHWGTSRLTFIRLTGPEPSIYVTESSCEINYGSTFQIVEQIIDDIVVRTCQYCGKVVDDVKDLPGHYTTKGCVAKKYQMQNGDVKSSETPVVIENAEDDIDEQIVPSDMEHDKPIILSDIEHDKHSTEVTSDWGYSATSQNGGDAFDLVASQPSFVNAISYDDNVTPVMVQSVVHADAFSAL